MPTALNTSYANGVRSAVPFSVVHGTEIDGMPVLEQDRAALEKIGIRVHFARGETIFSEGDEADYSYRVLSGAIRLCKHLADGRRQIADFILPGDFCGFLHLDKHRFTAEAASEVTVIAYPQRQVERLGEEMPSMRKRLMNFLATRLMDMQDHLIMLGRQTAKERVVTFLMRLAERAGAEDGEAIALAMSRQDIADYLGLTIETVCRVLSDLKRAGLIAAPSLHQVTLRDTDRLRDLAENCD